MNINTATYTDIGSRSINEDTMLTVQDGTHAVFVVADGLGGHGMGDTASQLVCETIRMYFHSHQTMNSAMFTELYGICQKALLDRQQELDAFGKMRTTLNILWIDETAAYWSHIGDSRTYYFDCKRLVKRTFDHSVPQMLAAAGQLKESEIRYHEDRNRLLRAMGVSGQEPAFDMEPPILLRGNQQFLLCSDGFWELVTEEEMLCCLEQARDPQSWMDQMVKLVQENGQGKRTDNATAIAVWIDAVDERTAVL